MIFCGPNIVCSAIISVRAAFEVRQGGTFSPDFRLPRSFRSEDFPSADDYIDAFRVHNVREKLVTWKLYNLCKLILKASEDTYAQSGQTFEVDPYCPLLRLLQNNVPDLELAAVQHTELYFLAEAASVIKRRFGPGLQSLPSLRHSPLWHQVWVDRQPWSGVRFGGLVFVCSGSGDEVFDLVNLDRTDHLVSFKLLPDGGRASSGARFYADARKGANATWLGRMLAPDGVCVISGESREHFIFTAPPEANSGTSYRLAAYIKGVGEVRTQAFTLGEPLVHLKG